MFFCVCRRACVLCVNMCVCACVYICSCWCVIGPSASGQAGGSGGAATHLRQAVVGPNNLPNWGAEHRYILGSQTSVTTKLQTKKQSETIGGPKNLLKLKCCAPI